MTATSSVVQGPGRLARALTSVPDPEAALSRILHPARTTLVILHPMDFAVETAQERTPPSLVAASIGSRSDVSLQSSFVVWIEHGR